MSKNQPKNPRVLAIAPSTRGFGFALFEGQDTLVDWGVKSVKGNKNSECIEKIGAMIAHYQPQVMVLPDHQHSRRSPRIRALGLKTVKLISSHKIEVARFSREQVMQFFFSDGEGTKRALAEILAQRFPEELGHRLPPKRKPWMSEDSRMDIFEAVALCLVRRTHCRRARLS